MMRITLQTSHNEFSGDVAACVKWLDHNDPPYVTVRVGDTAETVERLPGGSDWSSQLRSTVERIERLNTIQKLAVTMADVFQVHQGTIERAIRAEEDRYQGVMLWQLEAALESHGLYFDWQHSAEQFSDFAEKQEEPLRSFLLDRNRERIKSSDRMSTVGQLLYQLRHTRSGATP